MKNFTRILAFAAPLLLLASPGCDKTRQCRTGTVFVHVERRGAALQATSLVATIAIEVEEGGTFTQRDYTFTKLATSGVDSFELTFPSTRPYPAGSQYIIAAQARNAAQLAIGTDQRTGALTSGCTRVDLVLGAPIDGDLGPPDLTGADLTPGPDLTDPGKLALGAACTTGTECGTGRCVDSVCCSTDCTGQCEACDAPGFEGTCTPVVGSPHGTRAACTGTGECADRCDGVRTDACASADGNSCGGAATCAGGTLTPPGTCAARSCGAATPVTCTLGCFGTNACVGVKETAHGYYHSCAALTDGTMRCWGVNTNGEIAGTSTTVGGEAHTPLACYAPVGVVSVAALYGTTCAALTSGKVQCWGSNSGGQLGRGGATDPNPHQDFVDVVDIDDADFVVGGSGGRFCAHTSTNGGYKCWGAGILGDGLSGQSATEPVVVCAPDQSGLPCTPMTNAKGMAIGDDHTCVIQSDDSVACWGGNARGQLGLDKASIGSTNFPTTIPGLQATHVSAGNRSTCIVESGTGTIKCFGAAERLGRNVTEDSEMPLAVCLDSACTQPLVGQNMTAQFDETVCSLGAGSVRCWGSNSEGQLGDGTSTSNQNYAATQAIAASVTLRAVAIAAGGGSFYAIVDEGAEHLMRNWGGNGSGQLGDNSTTTRKSPVAPVWTP